MYKLYKYLTYTKEITELPMNVYGNTIDFKIMNLKDSNEYIVLAT